MYFLIFSFYLKDDIWHQEKKGSEIGWINSQKPEFHPNLPLSLWGLKMHKFLIAKLKKKPTAGHMFCDPPLSPATLFVPKSFLNIFRTLLFCGINRTCIQIFIYELYKEIAFNCLNTVLVNHMHLFWFSVLVSEVLGFALPY